jgi:hypothetical protein
MWRSSGSVARLLQYATPAKPEKMASAGMMRDPMTAEAKATMTPSATGRPDISFQKLSMLRRGSGGFLSSGLFKFPSRGPDVSLLIHCSVP